MKEDTNQSEVVIYRTGLCIPDNKLLLIKIEELVDLGKSIEDATKQTNR